jgi:autotransporter-associated beta strand protein
LHWQTNCLGPLTELHPDPANVFILSKKSSFLPHCAVVVLLGFGSGGAIQAANVVWNNVAGEWRTASNWSPTTVPTGTDVAQFGASPTANPSLVGVATKNATLENQIVGAIEITAARTSGLIIGNSSPGASGSGGTLSLNGQTINGINNVILRNNSSSNLTIQSTVSGSSTMSVTLGNATNNVVVMDGSGGITISTGILGVGRNLMVQGAGSGALTLSSAANANTYSGTTTISSATLRLGAANQLPSTTLFLDGGTLNTGGFSETTGQLDLEGSASTINLNGSGAVAFADSSSPSIAWEGTLAIWNWSPGQTTMRFGTTANGLRLDQLGAITVYNGGQGSTPYGPVSLDANGFLVVVPEPGAVLAGLTLLGAVGWRERRHFLRVRRQVA